MKKTILTLSIAIFIAGTILTGCNSSETKVEKAEKKLHEAKDNVAEAKQDLLKARLDSINDYEQFKKETVEIIILQRKNIADSKARIENAKAENKAKYQLILTELDNKNTDLENALKAYKADEKENWLAFKTQFINDILKLKEEFKELTAIDSK